MMPRLRPLDQLWNYNESKQQSKYFFKQPLNLGLSPDEEIFCDAKEEYNFQQKRLEILREEQKRQNEKLRDRVEMLKKEQDEMHKEFFPLNNFIREAHEKANFGILQINQEIEKQNNLKIEIEEMRTKNNDLLEFRNKFSSTVEEYETYEKVVKDAVQDSKTFHSVDDMIIRCDAIMIVHEEINVLHRRFFDELNRMKIKLISDIEKAKLTVLGLSNKLSTSARAYETTKLEADHWERKYKETQLMVLKENLNRSRALDGIQLIYHLLCNRMKLSYSERKSYQIEEQMDFIKDEVELLRDVLAEYYRRKSK